MVNPEFDIRPAVLVGETANIHLQRALTALRNEGINPPVTMEFYPRAWGVLCGVKEARALLAKVLPEAGSEVWALEEGETVDAREVVLRVKAPYGSFGLYETAITGILSSCTGWASAARQCAEAAKGIPVVSLAAKYSHPAIAGIVDYAAVIGGCVSCSSALGAKLSGVTPSGNMPYSLPILMGDTVKAIQSFDRHMPQEVPRVALIDTFKDEAEEALNVARALKEKLRGVWVSTARERGGVTPDLVKELRGRLDQAGFRHVELWVSGGITPERIREFTESSAPVNGFGVGAYICRAGPVEFVADIQEVEGKPVSRRGRIPGITPSPRLNRVM